MKSYLILVTSIYALYKTSAFSMLSQRSRILSSPQMFFTTSTERTTLCSTTIGSNTQCDPTLRRSRTLTINEQIELKAIRNELIQKYITFGYSVEYAEREVNFFLEDEDRSAQYVEMRRAAMARGNDLGIELIVQFGGAFLLGMVGCWLIHSWDLYQALGLGKVPFPL